MPGNVVSAKLLLFLERFLAIALAEMALSALIGRGNIGSRLGFADRHQQDGFGIPAEGPTIVMNLFSDLVKFLSDHCLH